MGNRNVQNKDDKFIIKSLTRYCFLLLSLSIIAYMTTCMAKTSSKDELKNTIDVFVKDIYKGEITKIECYYLDWGLLTDQISEEDLIKTKFDYMVTVSLASFDYLDKLEKTLSEFQYEAINIDKPDCRLSFLFFKKNNEVLRVSFVNNMQIMLVNGQPYKVSIRLLMVLLPILPHEAYEDFHDAILTKWIYSGEKP